MKRVAWVLFISGVFGAAAASGWERNPGAAADAFGGWGMGARAEALGRAYGARVDDAAAAYWNAAGLAALEQTEITFGYGAPFGDIGGVTVGDTVVAKPMLYTMGDEAGGGGSLGTLAGALAFRRASGIYEADDNGLTGRTFADTDIALYFAYAHAVGEKAALGVTLKDITRAVGDYNDSGFGIDLASTYRPYAPLNFGVVVRNLIGPNFRLEQIKDVAPLTVDVSGCYDMFGWAAATAAAEITREGYYDFGAGCELTPVRFVSLRGGYWSGDGRPRVGIGLAFGGFRFDYAVRLGGALGDSHLASVSFLLGGAAAAAESAPSEDEGYVDFTPEEEGESSGEGDGEGGGGDETETEPPDLLDLGLP